MSRELLLSELASRVGKTLPPHEVAALVEEARDHLEHSIQARLELGMSLEEAEREAIRTFGDARTVGTEVRRREPRFDRPFALSALAVAGFFAWAGGPRAFPGWTYFAMVAVAMIVHAAFLLTSAWARRPQFLLLATLLLPLFLGAAVLRSTQYVTVLGMPDTNDESPQLRTSIPESIIRFEGDVARARRYSTLLIDGYTAFISGKSILAPGRLAGLDDRGNLKLRPAKDRVVAEANWRHSLEFGTRISAGMADEAGRRAVAYAEAARRPWWAELPHEIFPTIAQVGLLSILGLYGGGHLLFWALGAASRRRRRGRMGVV